MRILGPKTSLATFRLDLVYLGAELAADERPEVAALAAPIDAAIADLRTRRGALEQGEDTAVVKFARLHKRDRKRDEVIMALGAVARATDKQAYSAMFGKLNPSETAKLGIDAESREIARVLGELGALDAQSPVRVAYEQPLRAAEDALGPAKSEADEASLALALLRSETERFKLSLDQLRLTTHGQLLALLKDKGEADSFFRPASITPAEDAPAPQAIAKATAGAPTPATTTPEAPAKPSG